VLRSEKAIAQMGSELVDTVAEVASGRMTKAEAFGFSDIAVDHVCRFV
jgi:altronate dehydratase large subunit